MKRLSAFVLLVLLALTAASCAQAPAPRADEAAKQAPAPRTDEAAKQ